MSAAKRGKKRPLFERIFVPVFVVLLIQAMLLSMFVYFGGSMDRLRENSYTMLSETVNSRSSQLQAQITVKVAALLDGYEEINGMYSEADVSGADPAVKKQFLLETVPLLIKMLRQSEANGAYIILEGENKSDPKPGDVLSGVCLRDLDQRAPYDGTEDILIERAPASIVPRMGLVLDSWWESNYVYSDSMDFYTKPLQAAHDNPELTFDDLAYLSKPYNLSDSDTQMISYSLPLQAGGVTWGIIGIELSANYLGSLLPYQELGYGRSAAYALAYETDGLYEVASASGSYYAQNYSGGKITPKKTVSQTCWSAYSDKSDAQVCAASSLLDIYNKGTPFNSGGLYVVGIADENELLAPVKSAGRGWAVAVAVSLLFGIICIVLASRKIVRPVEELADKVERMDANSDLHLDDVGIREIDRLTNSIETLSRTVSVNKAKNSFFSKMSHDMRTPMNAIIGFSSSELLDGATEAQKDGYLKSINESGKYMLDIINDILDISKISSDRLTLNNEPTLLFEPWDVVKTVIEMLAKAKSVQLDWVEDCGEGAALMDVKRVRQIFVNLLSNAVKYTHSGGRVSFTVKCERDGGKIVQTAHVKDNGVGISREFQKVMFDQFSQERQNISGTGLGLAITKSLVTLMGGTIECVSEQGVGTEFTVVLSFDECEYVRGKTETERAGGSLDGMRVLMCEDHPLNTEIALKLLKNRGIVCDCAQNGRDGLEMFRRSREGEYDAVLMDIRMPVMGGLEAAGAIRALDRGDSNVPIIALTANAFKEDIASVEQAGINDCVVKPIDPQKLYSALERAKQSKQNGNI